MAVDILNLNWSTEGRDAEAFRLINYKLRQLGYVVQEESIFKWRYSLLKHKPRLVLLMDGVGAGINAEVSKYCHLVGIPNISLLAEGILEEDSTPELFWGWHKDRKIYSDIQVQWSQSAKKISLRMAPENNGKLAICGAPGFDRYKIYDFISKQVFLKKHQKPFSKVVGYAGWGFEMFYPHYHYFEKIKNYYGEDQILQFKDDKEAINKILRALIEKNQDVLFLLKLHPAFHNVDLSECHGLFHYPNVLKIQNEETIGNCLSASDFWMAFESTTCLEGWLLNKQTLFINPSHSDFKRTKFHKGCPIFKTTIEVQEALDNFYKTGQLPGFAELFDEREKIFTETIQWQDGKNHMRVAFIIDKYLKSKKSNRIAAAPIQSQAKAHLQNIMWHLSGILPKAPYLKKYAYAKKIYNREYLVSDNLKHFPEWERFALLKPLTELDISELEALNADLRFSRNLSHNKTN